MPTLEGQFDDFLTLLEHPLTPEEMGRVLDLVKGEWKQFDPATGRFKIELNDTNRPDLWSLEGIARQIRGGRSLPENPYDFLERASEKGRTTAPPEIRVDRSVLSVRPFMGGFTAEGGRLGEEGLAQLIGTQERLSELFGRKRSDIAIGVYPLEGISFPLTYRAADPDSTCFEPLGGEKVQSLREILETHPKGRAYGDLVRAHPHWPILEDSKGTILSFPPVINARSSGEVRPGDGALFVEATGNDPSRILLVLNILAANLADRGYRIHPLKSSGSRDLVAPMPSETVIAVPEGLPAEILGEPSDPRDFAETLLSFGYSRISREEGTISGKSLWHVPSPFYRDDLLGAVDVIEDYLMAKGYDSFSPVMPQFFTRGRSSPRQKVESRLRLALMGMRFDELLSNILTGEPQVTTRLGWSGDSLVRIDNPASQQFGVVRPTLLAGLLSAEARSSRFAYPHRIFEVGEGMVLSDRVEGERTVRDRWLLAALLAHPEASVSELQGVLEMLFEKMNRSLSIRPAERAPFLPGRSGIYVNGLGKEIATIGEIHPEYLDRWGIRMPSVCFELDIEVLLEG